MNLRLEPQKRKHSNEKQTKPKLKQKILNAAALCGTHEACNDIICTQRHLSSFCTSSSAASWLGWVHSVAEQTFFPEQASHTLASSKSWLSSTAQSSASLNDFIHSKNLTPLPTAWPSLCASFHDTYTSTQLRACKPPYRNNTKFCGQFEYNLAPFIITAVVYILGI